MGEGLRGNRGLMKSLQLSSHVFIIIALSSLVAGCNLKEKISSSITDEIPEEEMLTEYEWPTGEAAKCLPELGAGVITYVSEDVDSCELSIVEISAEMYEDYLVDLQGFGYTLLHSESDTEGYEIDNGSTPEGAVVSLSYQGDEKCLELSVEISGIRE